MSSVISAVSSCQLDHAVFFEPTLDAVVVEWHPENIESFSPIMESILQLMQLHRTGKILAKVTTLALAEGRQLDWFKQDWLPRAIRAGYKAYAAVGPVPLLSDLIISPTANQVQEKGVKVSFFKTLPEAQEWLRGIG
jgi:hypothetical protein